MGKILVYHVKREKAANGRSLLGEIGDGMLPLNFPENHDLVAVVATEKTGAEAAAEAYYLTQNIDEPWIKNKGILAMAEAEGFRSTHIGDVMLMGSLALVCAPIGWERVVSADQKIARD